VDELDLEEPDIKEGVYKVWDVSSAHTTKELSILIID